MSESKDSKDRSLLTFMLREADLFLLRYQGPPDPAIEHLRGIVAEVEDEISNLREEIEGLRDENDALCGDVGNAEEALEVLTDAIQEQYDIHSTDGNQEIADVLRELLNT